MQETEKMFDVICMEFQRSADEGEDGGNTSHTSHTTTDESREDESSEAEVQQLLNDHPQFDDDIHETMQEEAIQPDNRDSDNGTDTKIQLLAGR